jgi:phosphatidylglycerol:prolipoprotein diacylglycerol transferase
VPIAVIAFDFDPVLRLTADLAVRWQTLALAGVIAACLIVAGILSRRAGLRADDLLYITVAGVAGAVLGGRIGYGLIHTDVFAPDPIRLLDPASGGLDLALGVVGGVLAGAYVAWLLGASVRDWARLAAPLLLVGIGAGKLTMVLGGAGQGLPFDASTATAYLGPGPWGSLAPALPSHPSQAYEGITTLAWAVVLLVLVAVGATGSRDGRSLPLAVAGWAFLRVVISTTWRDPIVVGPLSSAGLLTMVVGVSAVVVLGAMVAQARRGRADRSDDEPTGPVAAWPDPESRPPF